MIFSGNESSLVICVPQAEELVNPFRQLHDPVAQLGMPAHITLLYPFLAPNRINKNVIATLNNLFFQYSRFLFQLKYIRSFPETLWLAPNLPRCFKKLTQAIVSSYPERQPYGGIYNEVIPHLTIADRKTPEELSQIAHKFEAIASKYLPLESLADKVKLFIKNQGNWQEAHSFALREEA